MLSFILPSVSPSEKTFTNIKSKFEIPMVTLTFLLLLIILLQELIILSPLMHQVFQILDFLIWFAFLTELLVLTYFAPRKIKFLKSHWVDVLIVIAPFLRVFRLFTLLEILNLEIKGALFYELLIKLLGSESKLFSILLLLVRSFRNIKVLLLRNDFSYILLISVMIVIFLGSVEFYFERNSPDANIQSVFDGIWWAVTTVTTVGYGDRYPVTLGGRLIGVVLMLVGITTFSLLTANISSFLVGKHEDREMHEILLKLTHLEAKIEKLNGKINKLS